MAAELYRESCCCFELGEFADNMRKRVRKNALAWARATGCELQYLAKSNGVGGADVQLLGDLDVGPLIIAASVAVGWFWLLHEAGAFVAT
jgi:hypothetical protein